MAVTSPPQSIRSDSKGEQRLFSILKGLPDNCFVYHEPVIRGRRPDFLVIMPDIGVLIIEVKGGQAGNILEVDPKTVLWKRPNGRSRETHPVEQAYGYRCVLMDDCRESMYAELLCCGTGRYEGRLSFPVGHCAVLSQISRVQLQERLGPNSARIFSPQTCITRDMLDRWETLDPDSLKQELNDRFTTSWNTFPGLSEPQIAALRGLVHPSGKVSDDPNHPSDIRTLDERQRQCAFEIGAGHRIITGVAGSGKTIILIARAKFLSETNSNVLLLCYNRNLADYFNIELEDYAQKIHAATFHQWAAKKLCGWQVRERETDGEYGKRALIQLKNGSREAKKYDAVLIDEAQDFPRSWFECARLAVKDPDPERGQLLIAGDGTQTLRKRDFRAWSDVGIKASGRTFQRRFRLDMNYRNTRQILEIAQPFQSRPRSRHAIAPEDDAGLAPSPIDPNLALRDGPSPELVLCKNREEECEYIAARVDALLLDEQRDALSAEDIAILYPYRPKGDGYSNLRRLFDRLKRYGSPNWLASEAKTGSGKNSGTSYGIGLATKGVNVSPIQGFKGLQARIVFLMWADLLPSGWREIGHDGERAELYVGLTRAEEQLIICHSRRSPFLEEIQEKLAALAVCE